MNFLGVITARTSSVRLPNKVLYPIEGKTVLEHLYNRVSLSKNLEHVVIATSLNSLDRKIIYVCKKKGWAFFVGNEINVLSRIINTSTKYQAVNVIRITADNIFTDPEIIDLMIKSHVKNNADYTITSKLPIGITAEIIKSSALNLLNKIAGNYPETQEHITPFIRRNENIFKINMMKSPKKFQRPNYRLTLDYDKDLILIETIFRYFYKKMKIKRNYFSLSEIISFLDSNPELAKSNNIYNHPYTDYQ